MTPRFRPPPDGHALTAPQMRRYVDAGSAWAWELENRLASIYYRQIMRAYTHAAEVLPRVAEHSAGGITAALDPDERTRRQAATRRRTAKANRARVKGPPAAGWTIPDADELGLTLRGQMDERWNAKQAGDDAASNAIRVEAMRRTTDAALVAMNISLDVRNPLVEGVLAQLGGNIGIRQTTRRDIMESLDESWKAGDSIPTAARNLRAQAPEVARYRSVMIARTELIGAVNGGAHAIAALSNEYAARDGLPPLLKIWLTAEDEKVRDTHVVAGDTYGEGQGIPMNDPFVIGGAPMQFPGDQSGPAGEVINCRCALSYEEGALTASMEERPMTTYNGRDLRVAGGTTAGGALIYEFADMPSVIPEDAIPVAGADIARAWSSVLCLEGVPTSDGRMLGIDSVAWRELPLTLMAQVQTDDGHRGAIIAGRIDEIEKMPATAAITAGLLEDREEGYPPDAVAVVGRGVFDQSWNGEEIMRLVDTETLRGVSIDLAPIRTEVVELPDADGGVPYMEIVTAGDIMGATVCPFPAFGEATIQTAADTVVAAMMTRSTISVMGGQAIMASAHTRFAAVDYSAGSMIAVHPTGEEAGALAMPGGQPAGDLHCTLAFLPDPDNTDFAAVNRIVAKVAADHSPITGRIGGAGYFAGDTPDAAAAENAGGDDEVAPDTDDEAVAAAVTPPAVADPETDPESEDEDTTSPDAMHPHVALVDAPGLSRMRAALCNQLDDAGVPYAQNHDFTPHITLGYEPAAGVPAMEHAHKPVSFGHIVVHEGMNRTAHPIGEAAVTASAAGLAPDVPPAEWFANPELSEPTPLTVTDDGRIYGHLATWGTCHIGVTDACVQPPESLTDYALFHLGHVVAIDDGELESIPCGTLTLDTGHADLHVNSTAARMHYDHSGTAAADIRVGDDEHGIWFAGAIRADLDARSVRKLRAAKVSGDWRPHDGTRELVAALCVNVPGFPVVRPRTAVAASGVLMGLVAAGVDLTPPPPDASRTTILALAERARPGYLDDQRARLLARVRA